MKNRLNSMIARHLTAGGAALLHSLGTVTMATAHTVR
jgi:hypothetical protein